MEYGHIDERDPSHPDFVHPKPNFQEFFEVFDKKFLHGILHHLVKVRWLPRGAYPWTEYGDSTRTYNDAGYFENVVIGIDMPGEWQLKDIYMWMATLMHETCHAVFLLFVCDMILGHFCVHFVYPQVLAGLLLIPADPKNLVHSVNIVDVTRLATDDGLTGHGKCWRMLVISEEKQAQAYLDMDIETVKKPWSIKG